jgi:hypothetical protein
MDAEPRAFVLAQEHRDRAGRNKINSGPKSPKPSMDASRARIETQRGRCAWSEVPLRFGGDAKMFIVGQGPCHPLYASFDHTEPQSLEHGFEIVCAGLNDLKGQLPAHLFRALQATEEWKTIMARWREVELATPDDHAALRAALRDGRPR